MRYKVRLQKSEEGYSVWCPTLPGCWSQGETKEEALENIKDAIQAYLETAEELKLFEIALSLSLSDYRIGRGVGEEGEAEEAGEERISAYPNSIERIFPEFCLALLIFPVRLTLIVGLP